MLAYTPWPKPLADIYRHKGYWLDLPLTDILQRQAGKDTTAVIDADGSYTYRELDQVSSRLAAALQRRGLKQGDTALVQLGNVAEFYVVYFALLKLGVAPVNAIYSHQRAELNAYASQIKPAILIADRAHDLFQDDRFIHALRQSVPTLKHWLLRGETDSEHSLAGCLAEAAGDFVATPTAADAVAFFQLSGGSTGTPKLIPRTHNDYYYSVRGSVEICCFDTSTCYLCALPAAHNFPLSSPGALGVFYAGGQVILAPDPSATSCFPLIRAHQATVTGLVPSAVSLWIQAVEQQGAADLASLQLVQVGGAFLSETLARQIPEKLGCQLQQVFGMVEGLVNYTRLDDDEAHVFTTQGRPISEDDEVWAVDAEGHPVAANQVGRLKTRGPYTFRGYYQAPEHNAQVFDAEGFYYSGDLISIAEDGYITVRGREKDQINRGGEKIAAEEIESLLLKHELIQQAALVSMSDPLLGEKSCAFLVTSAPVKSVAVRRFLREQGIAEYKLPDRIERVDSLPLTPIGKTDKKLLRQELQQRLTGAEKHEQ